VSTTQNSTAQDCWNRACDCFATAKIFEKRALEYRKKLNWLSYLGIGVPAVFGGMALAWGKGVLDNRIVMFVIAIAGIVQIAMSVAALIHHWAEEHAYSNRSASTNFQLSDEFKILAPQSVSPPPNFQHDLDKLLTRDRSQTTLDNEKHVTDQEKSRGHRHALRQFQRTCAVCNQKPTDMNPTNCKTCGDFK